MRPDPAMVATSASAGDEGNPGVPRRLRVLVIHTALAAYRIDLFNRLAEEFDFEVVFHRRQILYHRDVRQDALRAALRCRFSDLRGNLVLWNRDLTWGIPSLLRDRQPDVVVTDEFAVASLAVRLFRRCSRSSVRHVIWSDESVDSLRRRGVVQKFLRRYFSRRIEGLLVCSSGVADAFAGQFAYDRHRISNCGVHQAPDVLRPRLSSAQETAEGYLDRFNLHGRKIVLFVGRLAPEKNLAFGLSAFARVFRDDPAVVLVVVGSGPERERLAQSGADLGLAEQMIFSGHCEGSALYAWYRLASVLLLPSEYEPYGAVINESLVFGVPVLCSDVAGAAHLVREGVNGFCFSPADQARLEDCFRRATFWLQPAEKCNRDLRANLMPVAFEDDVAGFVRAMRLAAGVDAGALGEQRPSP